MHERKGRWETAQKGADLTINVDQTDTPLLRYTQVRWKVFPPVT